MMLKTILNKGTLVISILFIITLVLMIFDPINLNPDGFKGTTALPALYVLPAFAFWYFYFVRNTFSAKQLNPAEKRVILYEKIQSILRKVLAVLGSLFTFNLIQNIPYLSKIYDVLLTISESWDIAVNSIEALIGVALLIASHFYKESRFIVRTIINPRKIEL